MKQANCIPFLLALLLGACGAVEPSSVPGPDGGVPEVPDAALADPEPVDVVCTTETCPVLTINDDPFHAGHSCLGDGLCPARGNWDPSMEEDRDTGELWLAYTGASAMLLDPENPQTMVMTNNTLLARSDDGGLTFDYDSSINEAEPYLGVGEVPGRTEHEVASLVQLPDGSWELSWFEYFAPLATPRRDFILSRRVAASPSELKDADVERYIVGRHGSELGEATHDFSTIPELQDCGTFTEPSLLTHGSRVLLAVNCISVDETGTQVVPSAFRMVLLERELETWSYLGVLFDTEDAEALGGEELTQGDLVRTRSGGIALVTALADPTKTPIHRGCYVFEVSDLETARVVRDEEGAADWTIRVTSDSDHLGPGLCTYDPASESGILLTRFDLDEDGLVGQVMATGLHP